MKTHLKEFLGVERIEKTSQTASLGKWLVLASKETYLRTVERIDKLMKRFFDDVIDEDEKIGGESMQSQEATSLTVEVHSKFFKDVLRSYDVDLDSWAVCQVSCFF